MALDGCVAVKHSLYLDGRGTFALCNCIKELFLSFFFSLCATSLKFLQSKYNIFNNSR